MVDSVTLNDELYCVKPLHNSIQYINDCCDLINLEWNRSHTARLRSIEGSCDNFPTSLILFKNNGNPKVVGHCKLSRLPIPSYSVFLESVIIHPDFRGKGLGKLLMIETEKYVCERNIKCIYLSTQGQEIFYEKLGYLRCPPVSIYGCVPMQFMENEDPSEKENNNQNLPARSANNSKPNNLVSSVGGSFPPPPPPMPNKSLSDCMSSLSISKKTYMKKELALLKSD